MIRTWANHFKEWVLNGYDKHNFDTFRDDIDRYNMQMLLFFNRLVLVVLIVIFISGFLTEYMSGMQLIHTVILAFTVCEIAADKWIFFKNFKWMDAAVFLCMSKISVFCIVSGIFYSPTIPAITFYTFMIVLSILFIVRPWKMNLYNLLFVMIFCACSYLVKPLQVAKGDIYNCCMFYLITGVISFWIVKLRIGAIKSEGLLTIQRDTDMLTSLPNRRNFNVCANEAFNANKTGTLHFMMMDIDHFKTYNDTKGHIAGDYCLEVIGKSLKQFGQEHQIYFARYGGEEFVAIDTRHSREELRETAEEIVQMVYNLGLPHESSTFRRITISVGYASQTDAKSDNYVQLLDCADRALYYAKEHGRNKIADYRQLISL